MTEIEDELEIKKILGQFELSLNGIMAPLQRYGQLDYVVMASKEIVKLAWQMHWKLCGLDIPYEVEELHW